MAMEKIATITPVGCCGCGLKRQKATKFRLAAASIISMPIKIKMAWRRLSAASSPMQNSAAETMRKSSRVIARASRAGDCAIAIADFDEKETKWKFVLARRQNQHAGARALPRQKIRASSFFLHH